MGLNKPSGNMYPWAYTWNPIGGKCPHACTFCYVEKKIAPWLDRMGNDKFLGEPRLIEDELDTKLVVPDGYIIFVESCGDLFAYGIDEAWILEVLNRICYFPQTTFLLQTKNPQRFFDFNIPQNCILGTTIESNRNYKLSKAPSPEERYHVMHALSYNGYSLMLSLEPIMDFALDILVNWIKQIKPEFISIGADSGKNDLPEPSSDKLHGLIKCLRKTSIEVRLKDNLKRLL